MSVRRLARRAALKLPPLARLYSFAQAQARQAEENARQAEENQRHAREEAARANRMLDELAVATEARDSLELQLYVLRSDHQRTASHNDTLRAELKQARAQVETLHADLGSAVSRLRDLERALAQNVPSGPQRQDLELLYAKLSARLTLLTSDIAELRAPRALHPGITGTGTPTGRLYLDLLEKALIGELIQDEPMDPWSKGFDPEIRMLGRDWPSLACTMIGAARMRNLRMVAQRVIEEDIPGDFLEAGVWRGGACIYMRGILAAHRIADRRVWVADSFAGPPPPEPESYPADAGDQHHTVPELVVPLEQVRANFDRYGLLDDQVQFLKGWFADTLPRAPIEELAILRLDGDMYSSTIQTLDALYGKVARGGFVIIDDYILAGCRQAVHDFRDRHGIADAICKIDGAGVFWRKAS